MPHGAYVIRSTSTTHRTIALGTGESEFYSIVEGAGVVLGNL